MFKKDHDLFPAPFTPDKSISLNFSFSFEFCLEWNSNKILPASLWAHYPYPGKPRLSAKRKKNTNKNKNLAGESEKKFVDLGSNVFQSACIKNASLILR